jgi:hypothetical protein
MRVVPTTLPIVLALVAGCKSDRLVAPRTSEPDGSTARVKTTAALTPDEGSAEAISKNIRALHMPYGTMADPGFASADPASADYSAVVSYNRTGDAAIWTGHYLAGESYRYAVTQLQDALDAVHKALDGVQSLVDVTSPADPDVLARSWVPQNSPFIGKITTDEGHNGMYPSVYNGQQVYWIGNTTRDQYAGVFFGLAVAYDMVSEAGVRTQVATLVTRMLDYLLAHQWSVQMPDGSYSTTFLGRPDQQLALLQIGRHVNPAKYEALYTAAAAANAGNVGLPVTTECQDTYGSYYKFNLDYITFFNLVRLEPTGSPYRPFYANAYKTLRKCTSTHENAHFNMIDRALTGADKKRDTDTQNFLGLWLQRSRRDDATDVSNTYQACGTNRACGIVAVNDRPNTDFLWQRSPQLLYGGGDGTIETAGIDYLLPYWMGRYYGVLAP